MIWILYGNPEDALAFRSKKLGNVVLANKSLIKRMSDISRIAENIMFCRTCIDDEVKDKIPENVITLTYKQMSDIIMSGKGKLALFLDKENLMKGFMFVDILLGLVEEEIKEKVNELDTDIGDIHCFLKHMDSASKSFQEIIEKAIRLGIEHTDLIIAFARFRAYYESALILIYTYLRENKVNVKDLDIIIDNIRRVRGSVAKWLYKSIPRMSEKDFIVFHEDYRELTANLDHANHHLVLFKVRIYGTEGKCEVCSEDMAQ